MCFGISNGRAKKLQHYSQTIWQVLRKIWPPSTMLAICDQRNNFYIWQMCCVLTSMIFFEQLGMDSLQHTDNVFYQHELFSRNVTTKWTQMAHVGPNISLGVESIRYILMFIIMLYSSQRLSLLSSAKYLLVITSAVHNSW